MRKFMFAIMLVLISVCSVSALSARRAQTGTQKPEWLTNPQSRYPQGLYLTAIGEGSNRGRAEADATANLARVFEVKVETDEFFSERYQEIATADKFQAATTTDIDRSISMSASQTLYNIQFGESYSDNMGKVFVLAYIDRHKTGDIYVEMINNHATRVNDYIKRAEVIESPIHKYAYLSKATVISSANELLLAQLSVISPDYRHFIDLGYNHHELSLKARESAQAIHYRIEIGDDDNGRMFSVVAEMLTDMGFTVSDNGQIKVQGQIDIEPIDLGRPEHFVRWHLSLNILDLGGNRVVSHAQNGREGHINPTEAAARAFRTMEREVRQGFKGKLFSYFDNLGQ